MVYFINLKKSELRYLSLKLDHLTKSVTRIMKFYEKYISQSTGRKYIGNLQIFGRYQWGYINLLEEKTFIIIPELKNLNRSFHEDLVEVSILDEFKGDNQEYLNSVSKFINSETQILFGTVINNNSDHKLLKLSGVLEITSKYSFGKTKKNMSIYQFLPYNKKYPPFYVPSNVSKGKQTGHNVYAHIQFKDWEITSKYPNGMCQQIIGSLGDIDSDYQYILFNHGLNYKKNINSQAIENIDNSQNRQDYRQHQVMSIDPLGCQDIDDAINIISFEDGYLIQVHIADVSNFVLEDSQLDMLARKRISSIYAPHKQINMLPDQLSTNLCSLLEQQERFVVSTNYYCNSLFKIERIEVTNGLIKCNFNLEYGIADQLLNKIKNKSTKKYPAWVSRDLNLLHQFISMNNILDRHLQTPSSHDLIDTMMVLTNSQIAQKIHQHKDLVSLLRIHQPSQISQLQTLNKLTQINSNKQVSDFLEIYYSQSAEYVVANKIPDSEIGHYGLKTKFYTHFTSPIRRYWDILVHRQIKRIINNQAEDNRDKINTYNYLCNHINQQHKIIKICQRQLDNRNILDKYLDNQKLETPGFITRLSEQYIQVYIPEMNICHDFRPFSMKLDSLLNYDLSDEQLRITNRHNHQQVVFKLMDSLELSLVYFRFYPVDKQLSISIIHPNTLEIIN